MTRVVGASKHVFLLNHYRFQRHAVSLPFKGPSRSPAPKTKRPGSRLRPGLRISNLFSLQVMRPLRKPESRAYVAHCGFDGALARSAMTVLPGQCTPIASAQSVCSETCSSKVRFDGSRQGRPFDRGANPKHPCAACQVHNIKSELTCGSHAPRVDRLRARCSSPGGSERARPRRSASGG